MKLLKRFAFSLVLFTGMAFILTSCGYTEPTLISFDGVDQVQMGENKVDVTINFTVNNPNSSTIKLKSSKVDISINKIFVGTATLLEPTVLPGKGEYPIAIKSRVVFDKTISQMASSFGMAVLTNNLEMHVVGNAKGSMGLLKRSFDIDYTEKIDWNDLKKMVM